MAMKGIWALPAAFLVTTAIMAEEQSYMFQSVRNNARGGSYVAAFDSDEAGRFNPAALAERDISFQLRALEMGVFVGENVKNTINDLTKSFNSNDPGVDFLRSLDEKFGKRQYGRMQLALLNMRFGAFEISPFGLVDGWLEIRNPSIPAMQWQVSSVAGMGISYAKKLSETLALGVTLRPFYRWYLAGDINFVSILDFVPPSQTKFEDISPLVSGFGLGGDVGLMFKPSKTFRLGVVVQNIGDAEYFQKLPSVPPALRQSVSTGLLYRRSLFGLNWDTSLDYQGIVNRDGLNILRLVHYGFELGKAYGSHEDNDMAVAIGMNEGYLCYGAFFDLWLVRLGYSKYTVELGEYPGQRLDRRESLNASLKLTF